MEYVANAKGETVLTATAGAALAVQPASVGTDAATASQASLAAIGAEGIAAAAVSLPKALKVLFAISLIAAFWLGVLAKAIL